eukprot:6576822-Prymnesium_polylepis.1
MLGMVAEGRCGMPGSAVERASGGAVVLWWWWIPRACEVALKVPCPEIVASSDSGRLLGPVESRTADAMPALADEGNLTIEWGARLRLLMRDDMTALFCFGFRCLLIAPGPPTGPDQARTVGDGGSDREGPRCPPLAKPQSGRRGVVSG